MAIGISTFTDLYNLRGTAGEDLKLLSDLDAKAEGFDVVDSFNINRNISGNGHTISNVHVLGAAGVVCATATNIYFKNWSLKTSSSNAYPWNGKFTLCRISICINNSDTSIPFDIFPNDSGPQRWCSVDITVKGLGTLHSNGSGSLNFCNVIVRGSKNINLSNDVYLSNLYNSALVFSDCTFNGTGKLRFSGSNSYLAAHNCTVSSGVTAYEPSSNLLCGFSASSDNEGTVVSSGQLQSESYLREIGFIP